MNRYRLRTNQQAAGRLGGTVLAILAEVLRQDLMKTFFGKRSKKADLRQAVREARKAARPVFEPREAELDFISSDSGKYYRLNPVSIPGYTYSF